MTARAVVLIRRTAPMLAALLFAAGALRLAPPEALAPSWLPVLPAVLAIAWVARAPLDVERDDTLPALAIVLCTLGLLEIARLSPELARKQMLWIAVSLALAVVAEPAFARFRRLAAYKYVWVLASFALFGLLLLFGREVNGARLWIAVGPVQYEPVELVKICLVFFLAAYLGETGDVIAATPAWSVRANLRYLGPLLLGWGPSVAMLVLQHDVGTAALLLLVFTAMLYVATRRADLIAAGCLVFAGTALWAFRHFAYVARRVDVWLHPFAHPFTSGYQSSQAYYSLAAGGLFGTGYALGHPTFIPDVATDYIYAAISEEFGALGALALLAVYVALIIRILAIATEQPDLYAKVLGVGIAATLGFQVIVIVGGVLGMLPLTGITLPFVSYGGSSLTANILLVSLAWAMSSRTRQGKQASALAGP